MSAQKFMTQVSVAMLDVDEIKTQLPSHKRSAVEGIDDPLDFSVGEQGIISRQFQAPVQKRMVIKNARFRAGMFVRAAVSAGVRQLQANY
jgi:hypothetical protein